MHIGIEIAPHLEGEWPHYRWLWWPPLRMQLSLRSLYQRLRDARTLFENAEKIKVRLRAEDDRMVTNSQMPGPQMPAVALDGLRLVDRPQQRCGS